MLHSISTCYTVLHLPKSSLTPINKTVSDIARLLMTCDSRLICFVECSVHSVPAKDKSWKWPMQKPKPKGEKKAKGMPAEGGGEMTGEGRGL